jgi:hypothetical protein
VDTIEHRQVARTLEFLGWVVIAIAIIAGAKFGMVKDSLGLYVEDFSWTIAIGIWLSGLIFGFSLIGLGRLIELLLDLQKSVRDELTETRKQLTSVGAKKDSQE